MELGDDTDEGWGKSTSTGGIEGDEGEEEDEEAEYDVISGTSLEIREEKKKKMADPNKINSAKCLTKFGDMLFFLIHWRKRRNRY